MEDVGSSHLWQRVEATRAKREDLLQMLRDCEADLASFEAAAGVAPTAGADILAPNSKVVGTSSSFLHGGLGHCHPPELGDSHHVRKPAPKSAQPRTGLFCASPEMEVFEQIPEPLGASSDGFPSHWARCQEVLLKELLSEQQRMQRTAEPWSDHSILQEFWAMRHPSLDKTHHARPAPSLDKTRSARTEGGAALPDTLVAAPGQQSLDDSLNASSILPAV